jgi:predicted nucleic acid-binding protein
MKDEAIGLLSFFILHPPSFILPLTEDIGHRASVYLEEYALKSGTGVPDALIAATAVENRARLCSGNVKRYRAITDLELQVFRAG